MPDNMWWRVLIEKEGVKYYFTVKADNILAAINVAMVSAECGVKCVIKAKPRKPGRGFMKLVEKFPDRSLFRGEVEED